ncbi:MAG TPA: type II toxin-antitoxin system RelE/ParE family toxin [Edaphobacter sp.]|nr:type II toxin-antitoxin system RelE/ParE family toxin [Edaphobacter sp.]
MNRFVLTPLAEQDLNEIWGYIGDDSVEAANNVLSKIEAAIYRLAEHPGLGHLREDLADRRHRFYLVYSYLIVFRSGTDPLQIIRVLHAARDVQTILGLTAEEAEREQ